MYAVIKDNVVLAVYGDYPPAFFIPDGSQVVSCIDSIPDYNSQIQSAHPPASPTNAPSQYVISTGGTVLRVYVVDYLPIQQMKSDKIDSVTAIRIDKENAGFVYNDIRYDTKPTSLQNINGMMTRLLITEAFPEGFPGWIAEDNSIIPFTVDDFKLFAVTACDYVSALYALARMKKDEIQALETIDDVIAYDIYSGW